MTARLICYDRLPPGQLAPVQRLVGTKAVAPFKQWINGSTLRVRFIGGTAAQQQLVQDVASEWLDHANLKFVFGEDPRAEIRVAFDTTDGAWSYIGIDSQLIPLNSPTMNFGWLDKAVILHEFGHCLGFGHEHQNPAGGIVWNEAAVIADLSGPPNYWTESEIRHNVLTKYASDQIAGTVFDPLSIMLYAMPDAWAANLGPIAPNTVLSSLDKAFVASARMYPGAPALPVALPVLAGTPAAIGKGGEEDLFTFTLARTTKVVVETHGSLDLKMALFGPNSQTVLVAEDDDTGIGFNPRITKTLQPGRFYVRVQHYNAMATGAYQIRVTEAG